MTKNKFERIIGKLRIDNGAEYSSNIKYLTV